jgi:hypothetical protein
MRMGGRLAAMRTHHHTIPAPNCGLCRLDLVTVLPFDRQIIAPIAVLAVELSIQRDEPVGAEEIWCQPNRGICSHSVTRCRPMVVVRGVIASPPDGAGQVRFGAEPSNRSPPDQKGASPAGAEHLSRRRQPPDGASRPQGARPVGPQVPRLEPPRGKGLRSSGGLF